MRLDRPVLRSILPFVFCLAAGVQFTAWRAAFDALGGRTPGCLWASLGILLAGCAGGVLLGFALYPAMRRPGKLCIPLGLAGMAMCAILLRTSGHVEFCWQRLLVDYYRSPGALVAAASWTACLFFAAPALLAGLMIPAPLFSVLHSAKRSSCLAGALFLAVCLSPFLAGILFSPAFVDSLGVESVTRACLVAYGATALAGAVAHGDGAGAKILASLACSALFAGSFLLGRPPRKAAPLLNCHAFAKLVHRDSGFAKGDAAFDYRTGGRSVSLYEDPDYGFVFCQDGRPKIFGNRFFTARTLAGYLPLVLRPGANRVAVVGGDAGFAVPFLVRGGVAEVEVCGAKEELLRAAVAADDAIARGDAPLAESPVFAKIRFGLSREAIAKPRSRQARPSHDRVNLAFFGRDALVASANGRGGAIASRNLPYDLVCLEPEPAWMRGTAGFYSAGMFREAGDRVGAGGLVTLHLDARALSTKRFVAVCRDFMRVFPEIQLWNLGLHDWMLVGSKSPVKVQADRSFAFMEQREVTKDMLRAGLVSLADIFCCLLCDGQGIKDWLDRAESENAVQSAFRLPELVLGNGPSVLRPNQLESCRRRTLAWLEQGALDKDMYRAIRDKTERNVEARVLAVAALAELERNNAKGLEAARDAGRMNPRDILLAQFAGSLELEGRRRIALGDFKGARKCYEHMMLFDAKGALAHYGMAYCLRAQGENQAAFQHFVHAVNAAPEQVGYRLELAQVAGVLNDLDEAERQYRVILKKDPENAEAYFRYAKLLCNRERGKPDFDTAVRFAEKACVLTKWKNREYAYGLAEVYMDAGRTLEGMGLKRRLKQMLP